MHLRPVTESEIPPDPYQPDDEIRVRLGGWRSTWAVVTEARYVLHPRHLISHRSQHRDGWLLTALVRGAVVSVWHWQVLEQRRPQLHR